MYFLVLLGFMFKRWTNEHDRIGVYVGLALNGRTDVRMDLTSGKNAFSRPRVGKGQGSRPFLSPRKPAHPTICTRKHSSVCACSEGRWFVGVYDFV